MFFLSTSLSQHKWQEMYGVEFGQNQTFPSIIVGLNLTMTSRVYEDDISQLNPPSIEKWLSYDDFKNAQNLEACQILAIFLQNVTKLSKISW